MDWLYIVLDDLRFDIYYASFKSTLKNYERVIIKVLQKDLEKVVIETINGKDIIVYDTRQDKSTDLLTYDLTFLKVMERFTCDREIPGMIYEKLPGVGAWCRVKKTDANGELIKEKFKDYKFIEYEQMKEIFFKIFDI